MLAGNQQISEIGVELAANSPRYDFVPKSSQQLDDEYSVFTGTDEVFKLGSTGIQTSRDAYVTDFDREALVQRFVEFCNSNVSNDFLRKQYGLEDGRNWKLADARMKLRKDKDWRRKIVKCHFRPLDYRWMLYHSSVINWPRPEVMPHMLGPNVALVVPRNYQAGYFDAALVSRFITEVKLGESTRGSYCFPLYTLSEKDLFESPKTKRSPNISDLILNRLLQPLSLVFITNGQGDLERTLGPEGILAYIYAILYSNEYRKRYSEFIKNGFPRVPLTCTRELFGAFARLGNELVALHLMESPKLEKHLTKFVGKSDNEVAKVRYEDETVWINSVQGFQGVVEDVWNFHIGGYQVCEKWLKDRRGRVLSDDDITHYHKIVVAISETIRLMAEIDKVIEKHGGWPNAFISSKEANQRPSTKTMLGASEEKKDAKI